MRTLLGVAGALALGAATVTAQNSNDVEFNNGGDVVFIYSDPSVGGAPGGTPDPNGDLVYKSYSGTQLMAHGEGGGVLGGVTMEVDAFTMSYFDTDWTTTDSFYSMSWDLGVVNTTTNPGNIEPEFFTTGYPAPNGVEVIIGTAGFLPPLGCPPPGYVSGYIVHFGFGATVGSGITVPADGTAASHMTETIFLPGGMVFTSGAPGACGIGDYILQDVTSTDETQGDDLGGNSAYGGFQVAGSGPIPDTTAESSEWHSNFRERVLNMIGDSGGGFERGEFGGGATNGLKLPVASGVAAFSYEVRSGQDTGGQNIAFAGTAISPFAPLPPPGVPVLGGALLVIPDGVFNATFSATAAQGLSVIDVCAAGDPDYFWCFGPVEGAADFADVLSISVPASAVGVVMHSQGAVFQLASGTVNFTNRVQTRLLP